MTTLRDLIHELAHEAQKIKERAKDIQQTQLDDDMQQLDEIEEELTEELIDDCIIKIKERIIG